MYFYGKVRGVGKNMTGSSTKSVGIETVAASEQGAVSVNLYAKGGVDYARISLVPWRGEGATVPLYDGPVDPRRHPAADDPTDEAWDKVADEVKHSLTSAREMRRVIDSAIVEAMR